MNADPVRPSAWRLDRQGLAGLVVLAAVLGAILYAVNWDFMRKLDFHAVYQYRGALLKGLGITLWVTALSLVSGSLVGVSLAVLYQVKVRWVNGLIALYVELFRCTPLLILLFWIHFALPQVTGVATPVMVSGVIAMSLQASAYLTEVARSGIESVPPGQWEACRALSIPRRVQWTTVVLPQAFKIMLPVLGNTAISFLKASTVLAMLAVGELVTVGNNIAGFTFHPIEVLTTVGLIFFVIGHLCARGVSRLEYWTNRSQR